MGLIRKPREVVSIRGFPLGINNVAIETDIPLDDNGAPLAARDSDNVDFVGPRGKPRRRDGQTKVLTLVNGHSLFGHKDIDFLLAREGSNLIAINAAMQTAVLATGLIAKPTSYAMHNDEIVWTTHGDRTGRIATNLAQRALGLPRPPGVNSLVAVTGGGLEAGLHRIELAYMNADGELSGTTMPASIELAAGQGIEVTLPVPDHTEVEFVRIYHAPPGTTIFYTARDVVAGVTTATINDAPRGDAADTEHLECLPAGHLIRSLNGFLWMANGKELLYTQAYRSLHHPGFDRIGFSKDIAIMEPVGSAATAGIYVGTENRVYWHGGATPKQTNQEVPLKVGAVAGSGLAVDAAMFGGELTGDAAYWMGRDGVPYLGLPGGRIVPLTKDRVAMSRFTTATSLVREVNGMRQIVTTGKGGTADRMGTADSVEVFQYRNGIPVP